MPRYDYHCDECGHDKEVVQSMADDHLVECPRCGGSWRRLIPNSITTLNGTAPRTLGTLAEHNARDRERSGVGIPDTFKHQAPEVPWRETRKINRRVLKNPRKYIRTGRMD